MQTQFMILGQPRDGTAQMFVDAAETRTEAEQILAAKTERFDRWEFWIEEHEPIDG